MEGAITLLQVKNLRVDLGFKRVLDGISLDVNSGEILCVVGRNGCGKTTLLRCMVSEIKFSSGKITVKRGAKMALLKQETILREMKVMEYLLSTHPKMLKLRCEMKKKDVSPSVYADYYTLGGYKLELKCRKTAMELGFEKDDVEKSLLNFSEGQRRMWSIAKLLIQEPDILLMDEPTNHLDILMRMFLEGVLSKEKAKGKAIIVVSHDRTFIDRISDKTLIIKRGKGTIVKGGYTALIEHIESDFEARLKYSREVKRRVKRLEEEITRKKTWAKRREKDAKKRKGMGKVDKGYVTARAASLAKKAKSAEKRKENALEKLKENKPFVEKRVNLSFPKYKITQRNIASVQYVSKAYNGKKLFEGINFELSTIDRIALIGSNGSGKTTLLRCMMGEIPVDSGRVVLNESAKWLYVPQNIRKFFKEKRLLDNFKFKDYDETTVRQFLGAMLLRKGKTTQLIDTLSPGELMKSIVVYAILSKAEFMFLDEPTNHLDVESIESFEKLLREYRGGLFMISHDRTFISKCVDSIFMLEEGKMYRVDMSS